jgi:short-subunit dehydrogenase
VRNIVILGASRGLGAALAIGLPQSGDQVWVASRSRPAFLDRSDGVERRWLDLDLASRDAPERVAAAVGDNPIEVLIYNAGIWEASSFDSTSDDEILEIINVNLSTLLLVVKHLVPNLQRSENARAIFIGSTCGLENEGSSGAAYVASKFGVRGAAHALRELLRPSNVAVTCLSPGSMATDVDYDRGPEAALEIHGGRRMPVHDVVRLIDCILNLSAASCVKEVSMPALRDTDV